VRLFDGKKRGRKVLLPYAEFTKGAFWKKRFQSGVGSQLQRNHYDSKRSKSKGGGEKINGANINEVAGGAKKPNAWRNMWSKSSGKKRKGKKKLGERYALQIKSVGHPRGVNRGGGIDQEGELQRGRVQKGVRGRVSN